MWRRRSGNLRAAVERPAVGAAVTVVGETRASGPVPGDDRFVLSHLVNPPRESSRSALFAPPLQTAGLHGQISFVDAAGELADQRSQYAREPERQCGAAAAARRFDTMPGGDRDARSARDPGELARGIDRGY